MDKDQAPIQPGRPLRRYSREQRRVTTMMDNDGVGVSEPIVLCAMSADMNDAVGAVGEEADRLVHTSGGQTTQGPWEGRGAIRIHFAQVHHEAGAEPSFRQEPYQP